MKSFDVITDPLYVPRRFTALDRFFLRFIRDERDLPFIYFTLLISFTLIPLAVLLFWPGIPAWIWWSAAATYLILNNGIFKGPFLLMMHCTAHRPFFKKEYNFWNYYHPWIIGPFFGQSPDTYFTHHLGMHHAENNLPDDESCTMPFQRDSLRGFLTYFGVFLFTGIYHLSMYFVRKRRKKLLYRSLRGELLFILGCVGLCFINWPATLVVFIAPFLISRAVMMMGNWVQHAFIDPNDPGNSYKNSLSCINTIYNRQCWNDGYHIAHHERPAMHFTELPIYFKDNIDEYIKNDAVVFDGIHYLHIFAYLMTKRYDLLAKHFVNIGNRYKNDEEVIAFLKSRTKKCPPEVITKYTPAYA